MREGGERVRFCMCKRFILLIFREFLCSYCLHFNFYTSFSPTIYFLPSNQIIFKYSLTLSLNHSFIILRAICSTNFINSFKRLNHPTIIIFSFEIINNLIIFMQNLPLTKYQTIYRSCNKAQLTIF